MFFVRADGNAAIGAGHLMRCLTVAEEIKKKQDVCVLCGDEASAALAESYGYETKVLGELPFSVREAEKICGLLQGDKQDKLLVDSYLISKEYVSCLTQKAFVICFDDMADKILPADMVVNYNVFATKKRYHLLYEGVEKKPEFLLGASYIPLREQFRGAKENVRWQFTDVLITTGGGDEKNHAGTILESLLKRKELENVTFHVVCGAFSPNYEKLTEVSENNGRVVLHKNVKDMAGLMQKCDGAVTAGGTTVYELCALGVPMVAFSYAENQKQLVSYLAKLDRGLGAGYLPDEPWEVIENIVCAVAEMATSASRRTELIKTEKSLVDGMGAVRLAGKFMENPN
ncbi:MAG: UDP-2,4-diacetamido-2,4,6-trideoxy-beta-L-altropyranose hydrolase [Lachnospiraceae bacterium]|nr:UDP-2,4-diacetamido-2,4,6-trideoxy-beta-L-altropyranose hydrolase [Lachnospiraceae bacterium]